MNELLAICRTRLAKSRRKAQDAETQLQFVEDDLFRMGCDWRELENELEVARCLFDSRETSPESCTSGPTSEEFVRAWRKMEISIGNSEKVSQRISPERANTLLDEMLLQSQKSPSLQSRKNDRSGVRVHRQRDTCHSSDWETCPPSVDELDQQSDGFSSVDDSPPLLAALPVDAPKLGAKMGRLSDFLKPRVSTAAEFGRSVKPGIRMELIKGRN
jgi:hypothetical protein